MNRQLLLKISFVFLMSFFLFGCGGADKGGIDGTGFDIKGTAAVGAPITNTEIIIKGGDGKKFTTITDANGRFETRISDTTGPILLKIEASETSTLYSIGVSLKSIESGFNTVNITNLTDVIIRSWFAKEGRDIDQEFASADPISNPPSAAEIEEIKENVGSLVNNIYQRFLISQDFDLIQTPFEANNQEFDLLLDQLAISIETEKLSIVFTDPDTNLKTVLADAIQLVVIAEPITAPATTLSSSIYVRSKTIAPGAQCGNGGISIESGFDTNGNSTLDADEVNETKIVCHGLDGLNNLVSLSEEPVGINCGAGGKRINIGQDTNRNNTLDIEEITESSYVCHGINSSNSTVAETNCSIVTGGDGSRELHCSDGSVVLVPSRIIDLDTEINPITGGYEIKDTWNNSAGKNRFSYRNHHFLFDVQQAGEVSFELTSNTTSSTYIIDSDGIVVTNGAGNIFTKELPVGTFELVIATTTVGVTETYRTSILGSVSNIRKIASDSLVHTGIWNNSGGRNIETFRNDHYSFTVENQTYIDILLSSSKPVSLYLRNSSGIIVGSYLSGALNGIIQVPLEPDTYELVAATHSPGISADYEISLVGHFSSFSQAPSNSVTQSSRWDNTGGRNIETFRNDHYNFLVTRNTYIDILLSSSSPVSLYLRDSSGIVVGSYLSGALNGIIQVSLEPDTYELVAATHSPGISADYELSLFGHFDELTKVVPTPVLPLSHSWSNSGGRNSKTYRNKHFDMTLDSATYIDVIATTPTSPEMYLIDDLGITVASGAEIHKGLDAGNYRLVVGTTSVGVQADFELEVYGQYRDFIEHTSSTVSATGEWTSSGGRIIDSPDNIRYSFEVTEESYVDFLSNSNTINYLYIVDSLGIIVKEGEGNHVFIESLDVGNYTLVMATKTAGVASSFTLDIVGQVQNLQQL